MIYFFADVHCERGVNERGRHEDQTVEEPILHLQQVRLVGETSEIATLISFANQMLHIGADFVCYAADYHGYQPLYFKGEGNSRGIGMVRYPRLVPKDEECAKQLAERTLTNLYNTRPTWLDLANRKLDAAVFAAYGWPADLSDDDLLSRLLALNLERSTNAE